ncbi:MAG TPA: mannitol dehydrogenase family protein, partial [Mycobacteriales bacterium]|nr:mannitol dehydrogenase family protein [Mycobacteriales bacterium]
RAQLAAGGPVERVAAVVASWARWAEGSDEQGRPIQIVDPQADRLHELAAQGGTAFLQNRALFGNLGEEPRFTEAYRRTLDSLHEIGAVETIRRLTAG